MKKIATLFILMFITSFSTIYGQNFFDFKSNDMYIEGGLRYGINIPFVPRHAYIKDFPQYGLDLRLGKQTDGTKEWEEWFNYPAYGFLFRYEHNTLDMQNTSTATQQTTSLQNGYLLEIVLR